LAHNLDAPMLRSKVETFLGSVEIHYPKDNILLKPESEGSVERRLRSAISFLLGQMEIMDYVVEFMEKSRHWSIRKV
jgi:hypothetical protein